MDDLDGVGQIGLFLIVCGVGLVIAVWRKLRGEPFLDPFGTDTPLLRQEWRRQEAVTDATQGNRDERPQPSPVPSPSLADDDPDVIAVEQQVRERTRQLGVPLHSPTGFPLDEQLFDLLVTHASTAIVWPENETPVKIKEELAALDHRIAERTRLVSTSSADPSQGSLRGYNAFKSAQQLLLDNKFSDALQGFDAAIDSGFGGHDVRMDRAICLQALGYQLDAIDDFDKAIALEPNDSNYYFMRSSSRGRIGDLLGSVADLEEAIRVAGIDNEAQRSHNTCAQASGHESVADFYRLHLRVAAQELEVQARVERMRREHPNLDLGPDYAAQRRASAVRRNRVP